MDCDEKCTIILKWAAQTKIKFDTSTVKGIQEWGQSHDFTLSQQYAIDNIIKGFKIKLTSFERSIHSC